MQILTAPKGKLYRLAFSPDGRYLAGGCKAFHLWEPAASAKPLWSLKKGDLAFNFYFTPNGQSLLGGSYGEFAEYDIRSGKATPADSLLCALSPEQFSPDGRFGVTLESERAQDQGTLRLRCAAVGVGGWTEAWRKEIPYNTVHQPGGCRALMFSSDGMRVVRVAGRGKRNTDNITPTGIEVFDSATGERLAEWVGELPYYASNGAVGPTGSVALLNARALYAINTADPNSAPVKRVNASPKPLEAAAFTRDGSRLAVVGRDTAATIWDAATWEVRKRYEWSVGRLRAVCFSPDGLRCAAAGDTGQVVVWDLDD